MQTTLHLLTRDGAIHLAFRPALSSQQYAELLDIVNAAFGIRELELTLAKWAFAQEIELELSQ